MSSYRSDGGRVLTPKESMPQLEDARSIKAPGRSIAGSASFLRIPRSHIARPTNTPTGIGGESSVSDAAEHRQEMAPCSKTPNTVSSNGSRPSLLPRPTGSFSSRPQRPPSSTVSPSTAGPSMPPSAVQTTSAPPSTSKFGISKDHTRNVLRRKAPTIGRQQVQRNETLSGPSGVGPAPSSAQPNLRVDTGPKTPQPQSRPQLEEVASMLPLRLPEAKAKGESSTHRIPKELAGLLDTNNLPPPTPNFASASSPSTRYSESPGVWSRESTPTSLSSYSPGIVYPTRVGHHLRQQSPIYVRPPMPSKPVAASPQAEKIETKGLKSQSPDRIAAPSLPSSLTGKVGQGETAGIKSPAKSPGPPRSPPPRKSSTQFKSPELKQGDDENKQREEERKVEEAEKAIFDYRSHGETTATPPAPSVTPPLRPSRDGTDKLELKPSPVVQSNLAVLRTTGHKRRESAENVPSAARPRPHPVGTAAASADSLHSRIPSRTTTPSGIPTRSMKTSTEPKEKKEITKKTSTRRFGIFTKRSKTELDGSNYSRADKPTRKGPAAGTGHEGYGKYGHRGRKSSVSSNSSVRGRSTSTTRSASKSVSSTKSSGNSRLEQDIDDFLLNRLEPVVITGGGMDGASHIRTHSEQSVSNVSSVSSVSLTSTSNLTGYTKTPYHGYSTESLASSAGAFGQSTESVVSERDHHMAMQVESQRRNPVLVNRNSIYGSQNLSMKDATKSTGSVNTASAKSLSSGHGYSSSLTALPQTRSAVSASKNERATQDRNTIKKLPKQGKSSKWNFFQRSRATDRKEPPPAPAATPATELHATISVVPTSRQVAHYALLDNDTDSLEDILHQIEESPPTEGEEMASPADIPAGLNIKKRRCQSILLPPTPKLQAEFNKGGPSSPKVFFSKEPPTIQQEKNQAPRPSRLMPVGRIPQVISRRDREHKPAQQSFSRPFCRDEAPSLAVTANCQPGQQYTFSRPPLGIQTDVIPSGPFRPEHDTAKPFSAPASGDGLNFLTGPYSNNEFLRFSPVKGSELSGSSSSEGKLSLEAVTAVNLEQGPLPTEDEVWDEYDDLIDSISPETSKAPNPGESNTGERFQLATMASKTLQAELNAHNDSTTLPSPTESSSRTIVPASARSSVSSVRLRRSRIVSALHSSITPSAQPSYSELIANYGDEGKKGADSAHLDVPSTSTRAGDQIVVPRSPSPLASTNFEASRHRNTILFDIAERDREGTTAQTNLRSGSLMASRWLSFGRVLFSPAHNHVNSRDQERILVIDGLGNDDWSFYCALTYPNATVYNLNIGSSPSASTHPDGWQPPDNYHVTYHPSIEDPFPFQKSFFAVCILRFPAACSEVAQSNIISECKRVLRPGGYLEMSILDLDLVSMGNWTRRAVRMLKERIYLADPNISLRSASDSIQRLLGRCGFDNLNRCMVRVPVAGIIVESSDSSSSNPSSSAAAATTTAGYSPEMSRKEQRTQHRSASDDGNMSLGDLLSGSPSSSNDESIAKIVTKVGRWWYTRCYEIPVLPDGDLDRSIWADKKLLRECQKRGTGFRLLIAYAQKPSEKRRTASV